MRAVTWQDKRKVEVSDVPDPTIEAPTDAIVRITSSGLCGSDLHLYEVLGAFLDSGDVLGHEPMGVVEAVGTDVGGLEVGDRVVVPFGIACCRCFFCGQGLQSQCETTQVREHGSGAALFGYTKLYGQVPGGQAEALRVPHADYGPVKVPDGPPDDRFLYLSDVLPTAWQAVRYAGVGPGDSLAVVGAGPIGEMALRVAIDMGMHQLFAIDLVPDRLERVRALGVTALDVGAMDADELRTTIEAATGGRGVDAVIDAVGMEAHGSPAAKVVQQATSLLPDMLASRLMKIVGVDRLAALHLAVQLVRRGGTISIVGVYGGETDPLPMMTLFDKQVQLRMGQANVRRWIPDILPLLLDDTDPLGVESFATHHLPLEEAPQAYEQFQAKQDGMFKVIFRP